MHLTSLSDSSTNTQRRFCCIKLTKKSKCWMSSMRTLLSASAIVGMAAMGYGMWSLILPGEERRSEMIKNLPESNPVRMEETRRRNALVMQAIKDAAETDENLARGFGPPPGR